MTVRTYLLHNAWWGKCLGAGLGFLIAGPLGALIGIFIGNIFDRGLNMHSSRPHPTYHAEKNKAIKHTFQKATFLTMGHICKINGRVSEEDISFAQKIMWELHLNRAERTSAKYFFTQGKAATFKLSESLDLLKYLAMNNPKLLRTFIQVQYRVAQVGHLTHEKIEILNHLLSALNLAPLHEQTHARETFYTHKQQHRQNNTTSNIYTEPPIAHAYALLNIAQHATKKEVKHAYRKQISLHHPDKHIAKGHSEAAIKQANEKTQAIRKAYESICKQNNW
jgi:DnaJ like chaperone protein